MLSSFLHQSVSCRSPASCSGCHGECIRSGDFSGSADFLLARRQRGDDRSGAERPGHQSKMPASLLLLSQNISASSLTLLLRPQLRDFLLQQLGPASSHRALGQVRQVIDEVLQAAVSTNEKPNTRIR